jgi:hypothetical protein
LGILIVVFVFPIFCWVLLWTKFDHLKQDWAILRFGSTYASLRTDSKQALLYNIFYMLRRLLIALIATFIKSHPYAQVQIIVFHCILMILYILAVKPFDLPLLNYTEIFNECSIISAAYHLFAFTDFLDDPHMQYEVGWSLIGVTLFNLSVNMLIMMWGTYHKLRRIYYYLK